MLRMLRRLTEDAYVAALGGRRGQRLNNAVLRMALQARGYGGVGSLEETGELHFINRLGRHAVGLCLDVGANRGDYARALLDRTSATVIAFEPHPATFLALAALEDGYAGRLTAVNKGVAQANGNLDLLFGENSQLASFSQEVLAIDYVGQCNVNRCPVEVTTIDSFLAAQDQHFADKEITLLKIDTEGFEYEVLAGARETIARRHPQFVQIEFNHHQLFRGHTLYEISRLLPGYAMHQIVPGSRGLRDIRPDDPLSNVFGYANFVFSRPEVRFRIV
jgi:FkbM family methyltransferase